MIASPMVALHSLSAAKEDVMRIFRLDVRTLALAKTLISGAPHDGQPASPRLGKARFALGFAFVALTAAASSAGAAPPDQEALVEQQEPHTAIAIDPKLLDAYAGFYRNPTTGSLMVVARDRDHLLTRRAGNPPVPEYAYTDHDFFLTSAPQQNTFVADAMGRVIRVVHHQMGLHEILERVSTEDGERELAAITERLTAERGAHTIVNIDPKLLDAYVGFYRNAKSGSLMVVTRDGDHLLTRRAGNPPVPEYPYSDRDFFLTVAPQQNSFATDDSGAVIRVVHHQMGREETLDRISSEEGERELADIAQRLAAQLEPHRAVNIDPHLIDLYVGRYRNSDWEISVTREGNQLFVQVTGNPRYPVYPFTDHDFFATIEPMQISFLSDGLGKATQLIRHQFGLNTVLIRFE
jgi:hypothetical protein